MRRNAIVSLLLGGGASAASAVFLIACGSSGGGGLFNNPDGGSKSVNPDSGVIIHHGDSGTGPSNSSDSGAVACPSGYDCNPSCGGTGTTITGKVFDPAGVNPLNGVLVYVPVVTPTPLTRGLPTSGACDCSSLYTGGSVASATTGLDGTFTINGAPAGSNVLVVAQIGKWRTFATIPTVTACQANPIPAGSGPNVTGAGTMTFPTTTAVASGADPNGLLSMPDIAVSTGSADTLECLMLRIGVDSSEYMFGPGTTGHIHVYAGGYGGGDGNPSSNDTGTFQSNTSLWDSVGDLSKNDITLLSCEGGETEGAIPNNLESYLNAGGRVFASHFHYAWFTGSVDGNYTSPSDGTWGTGGDKLACWTTQGKGGGGTSGSCGAKKSGGGGNNTPDEGSIVTTLNTATAGPFAEGENLASWLGEAPVSALGQDGVPAGDLSIYQPKYNAVVSTAQPYSQPWINDVETNNTLYFSFDTPVGGNGQTDSAGNPEYCGRAVFSDLHVAGNPSTKDDGTGPTPQYCSPGSGQLSPQEKALEFMVFDLSACVTNVATPDAGIVISNPQ